MLTDAAEPQFAVQKILVTQQPSLIGSRFYLPYVQGVSAITHSKCLHVESNAIKRQKNNTLSLKLSKKVPVIE